MSYISTFLAAILLGTAPLAAASENKPSSELVESNFKLGKDVVASVRSGYENGKYNQFMFDMDEAYNKADLKDLIKLREDGSGKEIPEEWEQQFSDLQRQKNSELLTALKENDDSLFATKVRSLASNILTPEQEKAISRVNTFIAMAPNSGKNVDENTLIDIDLEYEYKLSYAMQDSNLTPEERQAQQIALRMEKMDKMLQASKNFEDKILKQAVTIAHGTLDARLARNLDGADLNANAKKKSENKDQEIVYSILRSYQGQFSDLIKGLR